MARWLGSENLPNCRSSIVFLVFAGLKLIRFVQRKTAAKLATGSVAPMVDWWCQEWRDAFIVQPNIIKPAVALIAKKVRAQFAHDQCCTAKAPTISVYDLNHEAAGRRWPGLMNQVSILCFVQYLYALGRDNTRMHYGEKERPRGRVKLGCVRLGHLGCYVKCTNRQNVPAVQTHPFMERVLLNGSVLSQQAKQQNGSGKV